MYSVLPHLQRTKTRGRATRGIFVGYSSYSPSWVIYNPLTNTVHESRSVQFDEDFTGSITDLKKFYKKSRVRNSGKVPLSAPLISTMMQHNPLYDEEVNDDNEKDEQYNKNVSNYPKHMTTNTRRSSRLKTVTFSAPADTLHAANAATSAAVPAAGPAAPADLRRYTNSPQLSPPDPTSYKEALSRNDSLITINSKIHTTQQWSRCSYLRFLWQEGTPPKGLLPLQEG